MPRKLKDWSEIGGRQRRRRISKSMIPLRKAMEIGEPDLKHDPYFFITTNLKTCPRD
jgi:hypothetical protein